MYILSLQAESMEGVTSLAWKSSSPSSSPDICLSVRNPLDHSERRENVVIDTSALEDRAVAVAGAVAERDDRRRHHQHGHQNQNQHVGGGGGGGGKKHPKHQPSPHHFALTWSDATEPSTIRVIFPSYDDSGDTVEML